jgi:hypothetical protein
MDFRAVIAALLQTVPFIIPVIVALLGYSLTKRKELELTSRRERLDLINSRLNTFYGPLYVLTQVAHMNYETLIEKVGGREVFERETMDEGSLREWQIWVENIFVPMYNASEDLILKNAHLIREEGFPDSLLRFVMHASLYKAMLVKWKRDDFREYLPKIGYPTELNDYAERSYLELKHEQLTLIGETKQRQTRQSK